MTETHIRLFHFTSVEAWPAIKAAGVLNLSPPIARNGKANDIVWPAVVWLTDDPSFVHAVPSPRAIPDKSAVRITVRVPRYLVARFIDYARMVSCPPGYYAHLKTRGPKRWPHWWVHTGPLPMRDWQRVEFDGMTLYRPEAARVAVIA